MRAAAKWLASLATLAAAASAAQGQGFAYQWIFDITETPATFSAGLQAADGAGPRPAGYVAYSYIDTQQPTVDMTTNLNALANLAAVFMLFLPSSSKWFRDLAAHKRQLKLQSKSVRGGPGDSSPGRDP